MANQDDFIRTALRVPPDLHKQIHDAARSSNRTFNAEIIARLQESFAKSNPSNSSVAPSGVWIPAEDHAEIVEELKELRSQFKLMTPFIEKMFEDAIKEGTYPAPAIGRGVRAPKNKK